MISIKFWPESYINQFIFLEDGMNADEELIILLVLYL